MVLSKKNKIRIFLVSTLMMLSMCFLFSSIRVNAKEINSFKTNNRTEVIMNNYNFDDIPGEIKEPVDKGKKLVVYFTISLGAVFALVGGVLWLITLTGHATDMKMAGVISFWIGIVMVLLPIIINWFVPDAKLL